MLPSESTFNLTLVNSRGNGRDHEDKGEPFCERMCVKEMCLNAVTWKRKAI